MNRLCSICHRHYAVTVCDHCKEPVCSGCSDIIQNDPDDPATWPLLCEICYEKLYETPVDEYDPF